MIDLLCAVLFVLAPLVITPTLLYGNMFPRAVWLVTIGSVWLIIFFTRAWRRATTVRITWLGGALGFFLCVCALTSIMGLDPTLSWVSTLERSFGLGVFVVCALATVPLTRLLRTPSPARVVWYALYAALAGTILFALAQKFISGFAVDFSGSRLGSTFGNAIFFGMYLVLALGLLSTRFFSAHVSKRETYIIGALAIGSLLCLYFTQAKAAIVALGAALLIGACGYALERTRAHRIVVLTGALLPCLIAALFLIGSFFAPRFAFAPIVPETLASRVVNWNIAWHAIAARPLVGYGAETFGAVSDKFFDARLTRFGLSETYPDKPHNALLEIFVASGVVGVLAYGALLLAIGLTARRLYTETTINTTVYWGVIGFFVAREIQNAFAFETHGTFLLFIFMLAFLAHHTPQWTIREIKISRTAARIGTFVVAAFLCFIVYRVALLPLADVHALQTVSDAATSDDARDTALDSLDAVAYAPYRFEAVEMLGEQIQNTHLNAATHARLSALLLRWAAHPPYDIRTRYLVAKLLTQTYFLTRDSAAEHAARTLLVNVIADQPARQETFLTLAQLALFENNPQEAVGHLTDGLQHGDTMPDLLWWRGIAYLVMHDTVHAFPDIRAALEKGVRPPNEAQTALVKMALTQNPALPDAEHIMQLLTE